MKHDSTPIVQVHNMLNYSDLNINGTRSIVICAYTLGYFPLCTNGCPDYGPDCVHLSIDGI